MIIVILFILGWVACGLLAVFVGGLVDSLDIDDDCPIVPIFLLGPIGLFTTICLLLCMLYIIYFRYMVYRATDRRIPGLNILNKIYSLGRGDK